MHKILRYPREVSRTDVILDGYLNFHFITSAPGKAWPQIQLERGINPTAVITGPDGPRRSVITIRSSPWKAGHVTSPWHDEFDLDHGHVRYYGDHKPTTKGFPGATAGNQALLEAWQLHAGVSEQQRLLAPPLLLFRSTTVNRGGRNLVKGHVEFCGVAVIERLEHVVQRDADSGRSFPNIVLDLAVLDLSDRDDALDMRWIDDRRDPDLDVVRATRKAPESWKRWTRQGRSAIPLARRRVLSSRVKSHEDQLPAEGSVEAAALEQMYRFFEGRKHAFELLASKVTAQLLSGTGAQYREGWLTRPGGDGGVDFVARLGIGSPGSTTPLVVLGQAKCIAPRSSISPDQVARVVARLRRGWIGVFVTTGVFSRQAQIEIIDDQYPLVLVNGSVLVDTVLRMAAAERNGDLHTLLESVTSDYQTAVTYRRPEEILLG